MCLYLSSLSTFAVSEPGPRPSLSPPDYSRNGTATLPHHSVLTLSFPFPNGLECLSPQDLEKIVNQDRFFYSVFRFILFYLYVYMYKHPETRRRIQHFWSWNYRGL